MFLPIPAAWRRLALLLLATTPVLVVAGDKPAQDWDGLARRPSKGLDNLFVRPAVQFTAYQRVRLDPVSVEFDKDWDPNRGVRTASGRLSAADIQKLRTDLATLFRQVLAERLTKGGYPLVEEDGEEVLRVTAALVKVYVNAPSRRSDGRSDSYTMEPGRMTLFMELRDSVTGQLLARAVDTTQGTNTGHLLWAGEVSNSAEAKAAFRAWADALVKGLDSVSGKAALR